MVLKCSEMCFCFFAKVKMFSFWLKTMDGVLTEIGYCTAVTAWFVMLMFSWCLKPAIRHALATSARVWRSGYICSEALFSRSRFT